MDKSGLFYKEDAVASDNDTTDSENSSDAEDLGLGEELESNNDEDDEAIDGLNDPSKNELIVDMEDSNRLSRKEKRADMWFDKDIFKGIEEDEDLEEADVEMAISTIKKQGGKIQEKSKNVADSKLTKETEETEPKAKRSKKTDNSSKQNGHGSEESESSSSESESDSDFDENEHYPYKKQKKVEKEGYEEVPLDKTKGKKRPVLTPEELALGQELISSKKRRRELEDAAWNRYMFDDKDKFA